MGRPTMRLFRDVALDDTNNNAVSKRWAELELRRDMSVAALDTTSNRHFQLI
jgi:hypothetical protein